MARKPLPDLPAADGPSTVGGVKSLLKIGDSRDDDHLTAVCAAVNAVVRSWPVSAAATGAADWSAAPAVVFGANMLAARLFRRRNSPAGVEAFAAGAAVYVQRNDPDVALMLELGPYAAPVVG